MVRLKVRTLLLLIFINMKFQFLMVRLKEIAVAEHMVIIANFNSLWFD